MTFESVTFLFTFLPIFLILYFVSPRFLKNPVLFLGSLIFYAWGVPAYVAVILFSVVFNYMCGLWMGKCAKSRKKSKRVLFISTTVNVAVAAACYIGARWLPFPMGIGVYTLLAISYMMDLYRKEARVQKNFLDFAVYMTLFPLLPAGPVAQYKDMASQLHSRKESWGKRGDGAFAFIRGLAKKVLLAGMADGLFQSVQALEAGEVSMLSAWLGCAAFAFYVYFSFSGYADMAVGLGKIFGFQLPENFHYPYGAKSIVEFWQRWNITVSVWFQNYVYAPLGGNKGSAARTVCNILLVWLGLGLWYGPSLNHILWGLYHGVLLLLETFVSSRVLRKIPGILQRIYSLFFILLGWVIFFSPSLGDILQYLKCMAGFGGAGLIDGTGIHMLISSAGLWVLFILGAAPFIHQIYKHVIYDGKRIHTRLNTIVYAAVLLLCVIYIAAGA